MSLLEDAKRITEKVTGWRRPDDPKELLRERKPQTFRFKHDGFISNHPRWPLIIGSLDYPDEVLGTFDFVVASVHVRLKLDRAARTERIVRAVANPHTTVLGHMTGRRRPPAYDMDIENVLAACADHGVAVEVNANLWRP